MFLEKEQIFFLPRTAAYLWNFQSLKTNVNRDLLLSIWWVSYFLAFCLVMAFSLVYCDLNSDRFYQCIAFTKTDMIDMIYYGKGGIWTGEPYLWLTKITPLNSRLYGRDFIVEYCYDISLGFLYTFYQITLISSNEIMLLNPIRAGLDFCG